jgi:hypothetical protein
VTQPAVETTQSGRAADAVRTLQSALSGDYAEMRSSEIQLTEAILGAHAVTVSGRTRLQNVQRQLIDAINDPAAALGTPAGERQFLMFLRGKVAEMQAIVDDGALSDGDHARLTRALGSGYLLSVSDGNTTVAPAAAQTAAPPAGPGAGQAAGMVPALGSALGSLPQAAQGAATAPAQGAGGLAGLASGLLDRARRGDVSDERVDADREFDEADERSGTDEDADEDAGVDSDEDHEDRETNENDSADDGRAAPPPPREPPPSGPAQTRPARLL